MSLSVFAVPSMALDLRAEPRSVAAARRQLLAFATEQGAAGEILERLRLAVSEAVTNAVVHAYPAGFDGLVHVEADVEDGDLEVVVLDDGDGFRTDAGPGLGLGMGVITQTADDLMVRDRIPSGVEVWMRFVLGGED